jgi:hypothetical protein
MLTTNRSRRLFAAACLLTCALACRSKKAAEERPLPTSDHEAVAAFIKALKCEATSCDAIACVNVSDGQTDGLPSHLARCRWTDRRVSSAGDGPARCSYVHYSFDANRKAFGNVFISEPAHGDTCVADANFVELVKASSHYSGPMP